MEVYIDGNVGFLPAAGATVWFSKPTYAAYGRSGSTPTNTNTRLAKLVTELEVAPWGEDNLFPQNIVSQLDYCGIGKETLNKKAKSLYGSGLYWGKVIDYDDNGKEVFKIAKRGDYPQIDEFMRENRNLSRYWLEFTLDWAWFGNCFPELITSKDGNKIKRLVHQESCDARWKQASDSGIMDTVYLSKLWGATKDQFPRFDVKKTVTGLRDINSKPKEVDGKYIVARPAVDPYNPTESFKEIVTRGHRNIIYPVSYPSPNKTYYQVPAWDGARLSGWIEIAAKIPAMFKTLYEQAFNIRYHVEIPMTYFEIKYGADWATFTPAQKEEKRQALLTDMNKYLSGSENAYKTFVSYYEVSKISEFKEYGRVKITPIESKSNIEKDLLTSSAANSEILFAMGVNPNVPGAGAPGGPYSGSSGSGSNIREAHLVDTANKPLERDAILEPLLLIQEYNQWDPDIQWRFMDVILTTTDKGKGTEKTVS